jgi:TatD DNase family protein
MGCWFSVGPAMLASAKGQRLVSLMPKDRILPETDGPFAQREGKPLMPWDSALVYPALGQIWRTTEEEAYKAALDNLRRLPAQSIDLSSLGEP